jgi:predicted ABC-type ATPase
MMTKELIPYTNYETWAEAKGIKTNSLLSPSKKDVDLKDLNTKIKATKTDLGDAIKGGLDENSLGKWMDDAGNLLPERELLHQEIINTLFAGKRPIPGQPTYTLMGGGPATGKSSVVKSGDVIIDKNTVKIDSDAIKKLLPEYQRGLELKDANIASYVHEESSALAKRIVSIGNTGNYNVLLDGTGDGSIASLTKKIAQARDNGMKVVGNYVTCSTQEALRRNAERALKTGRLPPPEMLIRTHKAVSDIAPQTAHLFDEVNLFDTNDGVKLIATGGNGKGFTPVKGMEKLYQDFLDKAFE